MLRFLLVSPLALALVGCGAGPGRLVAHRSCARADTAGPADTAVYELAAVDAAPTLVRFATPLPVPSIDSGRAALELIIDKTGRAERQSVHVLSATSQAMLEYALSQVHSAVYCPAMIGNHYVRVHQHLIVTYRHG